MKKSTTSKLWILCVLIAFQAACVTILAQENPEAIAQREVQRRQAEMPKGSEALARAQRAMKEGNYALAHEEFRTAVELLPDGATTGDLHDQAVAGFSESGLKLAQQNVAVGKYGEAEGTLREVLTDRYDPKNGPASDLLTHMREPGYINRTMGPKFLAKVEEVKRLLADADGYYNAGRYDLAMKKYDQVLALDPYNVAARKGQERIDNAKFNYGDHAYNETRGRRMAEVQTAWAEPIRPYGTRTGVGIISGIGMTSDTARITSKLNSIIIPKIEFRDASIREAVDFLRQQAAANDPVVEGKRGVDIVLRLVPLGQIAPPAAPVEAAAPTSTVTVAPAEGAAAPGSTPVTARPVVAPAVVPSSAISPANARITISLNQIPLGEALRYVAQQAGLKLKVEPYAVALVPLNEQTNDLIAKSYRVPPSFFGGPLDVGYYLSTGGGSTGGSSGAGGLAGSHAGVAPVASNIIEKNAASFQNAASIGAGAGGASNSQALQTTLSTRQQLVNDRQLVGRADAQTFLQSMGVSFPPGASASYFANSSTLIVKNTADNLDFVDRLVEEATASAPKQIEIESKFIEITQNNLKELGFDWLLGPFNIGNHKVFGSGGTLDNGNLGTFPLGHTNPSQVAGGPGTPINGATGPGVGGGPVTAGNRSGSFAISANALDALLFPTNAGAAPGVFGLAGLFTDPQFQVVIRALNQKKGVDLLSAPKVTTKSGQRAIIEIVREFRYPTTFTPPQVPSISSSTNTVVNGVVPVVVTPTTPQTFETRNTGVTLEVEPVVGPDGVTIDLNLVPQVVEFEGFINYGSPINAVGVNTVAGITVSAPVRLTDNVINQPIFSTRKVTTSVQVADGQTVVLGGLMREDVQKTEDRTPIVGDLPLVGRLFRTNVDQHIKRNLIIFVTAKKVTPFGTPVEDEEESELLEQPVLPEPMYKK